MKSHSVFLTLLLAVSTHAIATCTGSSSGRAGVCSTTCDARFNSVETSEACAQCCVAAEPCQSGGFCVGEGACQSNGGFAIGQCASGAGKVCCSGLFAQSEPSPEIQASPGAPCAANGRHGACATSCVGANSLVWSPHCTGGTYCCLTARPSNTPTQQPPSNEGRTCSYSDGATGSCHARCGVSQSAYRHPDCSNLVCCLNNRVGASPTPPPPTPSFVPPQQPSPSPLGGNSGDRAAGADGCLTAHAGGWRDCSPCFQPSVHQSFLKTHARKTLRFTAYMQRRHNVQFTHKQINDAVSALNNMFGDSGIAFAPPTFKVLPSHLDPDTAPLTENVPQPEILAACRRRGNQSPTSKQCLGLYRTEHEFREFLAANHPNEPAVIFCDVDLTNFETGFHIGGLAIGGMPWQSHYTGIHNYVNLRNGMSSTVFIHEMGHSMGLFHTFDQFDQLKNDCAAHKWQMDGIPDTTPAPLIQSKCNHFEQLPCESTSRAIDTNNVMSYGFCNDGRFPKIQPGQLARIACCQHHHGATWALASGRSSFRASTQNVVVQTTDVFVNPKIVGEDDDVVLHMGDTFSVTLPAGALVSDVFLYKTAALDMPTPSEAEMYRVGNFSLAGSAFSLPLLKFANGDSVERGSYTVIMAGGATTYVTPVFTLDGRSCPGPSNRPWGIIRTKEACTFRGGSVHEDLSDGLVCCLPPRYFHDFRMPPTGSDAGDLILGDERFMSLSWPGESLFWGATVHIDTSTAPADGQMHEFNFLIAGQVETAAMYTQQVQLGGAVGTTIQFEPEVPAPNVYTFESVDGVSASPFSVVALPCRTSDDKAGYCLPTKAIDGKLGRTDDSLVCTSGDAQPCQGLQVQGISFACCAGAHSASGVQNSASYREQRSSAATSTLSTMVVAAILVATLMQ